MDNAAMPLVNIEATTAAFHQQRRDELHHSTCTGCKRLIEGRATRCGRCGEARHHSCTNRREAVYWYCDECTAKILESGPDDMSEDLALQRCLKLDQ